MITRRSFALGVSAIALGACARRLPAYTGPEVTFLILHKGARQLIAMHDNQVLRRYQVELGSAPDGPKQFAGDGRTPEGLYLINRRNPRSRYHLSLGISYPSRDDYRRARAQGRSPGGDIFIHGTPQLYAGRSDWTAGCIAVSNSEIEEIYMMVGDGTPILILP